MIYKSAGSMLQRVTMAGKINNAICKKLTVMDSERLVEVVTVVTDIAEM
jgi:hypothetical protein